jgi:hypothetical protein
MLKRYKRVICRQLYSREVAESSLFRIRSKTLTNIIGSTFVVADSPTGSRMVTGEHSRCGYC